MSLKHIVILLFFPLTTFVHAQDSTDSTAVDSLFIFTREQYLKIVLANHPVAKQADLISEQGKAQLRTSRGAFDPEIFGSYDNKDFQGKEYYEYGSVGLNVPTWFGLEVNTGWDWSNKDAAFASNEKYTPRDGTGYLGVSVPIGQNMIIDERRKALRQGQIAQQASEIEKIQMINQLMYDANVQYWKWLEAYQNMEIYESSMENATKRFKAIKANFTLGESSAMDTLEALTQIQAIRYNYLEAKVSSINERLYLSNYLWTEGDVPLEVGDTVRPEKVSILENVDEEGINQIMAEVEQVLATHPQVQLYQYKLESLELEKRYKTNKLLPKGKLKYNLLTEGYDFSYSTENYKWGAYLSFPLFVRQQRGEQQLYKLKIMDTQYKLNYKQYELRNKLAASNAKLKTILDQVDLYQDAVENYGRLLRGEEIKALNGESSLFKVNERELKFYKSRIKLNSLVAKFYQVKSFLVFAAGMGEDFYFLEVEAK